MTASALPGLALSAGATFSPCRRYRYRLHRQLELGAPRRVLFVMLNPSTADERVLDPTVRRCVGFARSWGFTWLEVANLFAWRSTDPAALTEVEDPVGPGNDEAIVAAAREAERVVCAWGVHGAILSRAARVARMLRGEGIALHHLALTRDGAPRHPLYLRGALTPQLWSGS